MTQFVQVHGLQELMDTQAKTVWPFDEQHYPGWEKIPGAEKLMFAINHILMHQAKAGGAAFEAIEPYDHGGDWNAEKLKRQAIKMFANALRLASILNISANHLVHQALFPSPE